MRLVKPNWVKHAGELTRSEAFQLTIDDKDRKSPIYSLSVHPDGTRLATGGIGVLLLPPMSELSFAI